MCLLEPPNYNTLFTHINAPSWFCFLDSSHIRVHEYQQREKLTPSKAVLLCPFLCSTRIQADALQFDNKSIQGLYFKLLYFRTIEKHADKLETLYARWKIRAPSSTTTEPPTDDGGLGNAELALIILGSVVGLLLLLGLCFAIKTRCRYMHE